MNAGRNPMPPLHPALCNQFPDGAPQRREAVRTCDFDFSHGVVMHMRFLFVRNLRYKQTEVHGGSPSVGLDSRNASSTEFECRLGYVAVEVGLLASPIQEIGLYSWGLNDKGHFPAYRSFARSIEAHDTSVLKGYPTGDLSSA
jgi:hypothetical protein